MLCFRYSHTARRLFGEAARAGQWCPLYICAKHLLPVVVIYRPSGELLVIQTSPCCCYLQACFCCCDLLTFRRTVCNTDCCCHLLTCRRTVSNTSLCVMLFIACRIENSLQYRRLSAVVIYWSVGELFAIQSSLWCCNLVSCRITNTDVSLLLLSSELWDNSL